MNPLRVLSNRRDFLVKSSGAAMCAACTGWTAGAAMAASGAAALIPQVKPKIRLVFTHPNPQRQGWPYQGYDYEGRKKMYISKLRAGCPNAEFLPVTVKTREDAEKLLAADKEVDGYLVYMLGIPSQGNDVIAQSGRPTLLVDDLYGGTGRLLRVYPQALKEGMPVSAVSSSRIEDVFEAVKAFECMKKMQASVLLDVTERNIEKTQVSYKNALGLTIQQVSAGEFNAAYEAADRGEAKKWAKIWMDGAEKIVEPSAAEIEKSAAMYVGMLDLLAKHKAQGITVDCLGLFYGGKITAYPCLGFFQLNSDGLVGGCEADTQSASTMLMLTYLLGRPGYISDPVIDTSKNQIIYAHCVATNRVYGPDGPTNPYHIRSHSEDRKGAAIRSLMPLGKMVTSLKLIPNAKTVVMHQAKTVANIDEDRACRTKLAAEVPDPRKLLEGWQWGWHRVTVYGDVRIQIINASRLMGFKVVEEG